MKSIKQQYIDLREGNMSQANFMRNLRMTMPQYITNVTSFEDSVRILKNKGILTEADEKGKWTNTSGKGMYDQFSEINNLNGQEVLIGIDAEMERDHELTKEEATKIVIKNLKKNPIYYTAEYMSGVEGYEPEYIGGKSANAEARQMQYLDKNMGNVVDKKMGMQPVKDVEKAKKDSDKATAQKYKTSGISLMSLVAKTTRGVKKMDPTGEKMKKIVMKEVRMNDFPGETPGQIAQQIMDEFDGPEANSVLEQYSDKITLQSNPDGFLRFGYWEPLPEDALKALEEKFTVTSDEIDADDDTSGGVFYMLTPKSSVDKKKKNVPGEIFNRNPSTVKGTSDLTKLKYTENKGSAKERLIQMIREELAERFDGMEKLPMSFEKLEEFDFNQIAMGSNQPPSQPKSSFEGKWTDIKDKNEFISKFHISNASPLVDIVSRAIGSNSNYAITNKDGKFYVYTFTQTANPGKPSQAFNSLEDAKKSVKL